MVNALEKRDKGRRGVNFDLLFPNVLFFFKYIFWCRILKSKVENKNNSGQNHTIIIYNFFLLTYFCFLKYLLKTINILLNIKQNHELLNILLSFLWLKSCFFIHFLSKNMVFGNFSFLEKVYFFNGDIFKKFNCFSGYSFS